jgi:hypothetical protein
MVRVWIVWNYVMRLVLWPFCQSHPFVHYRILHLFLVVGLKLEVRLVLILLPVFTLISSRPEIN